jgi:ubiquinone/menaquinone biosynthesis C-methylase UbiE
VGYLICPSCREALIEFSDFANCKNGHKFQKVGGILDLLPTTSDKRIIEEQEHWNNIAKKGRNVILPNHFIKEKMVRDVIRNCEKIIRAHLNNDNIRRSISIGEIGCGGGSAMTYLQILKFSPAEYYGADVSLDRLIQGLKSDSRPENWQINFIRSSANVQLFADGSLDIIFSAAALHHLDLDVTLDWISKSLKKGGIFILCEPSSKNPFASVGRRILKGFHTPGEKPLEPSEVQGLAEKNGLTMVYQKGEHFLTGPMEYLLGLRNVPVILVKLIYYLTTIVDLIIRSPSYNYDFIQAYKKL